MKIPGKILEQYDISPRIQKQLERLDDVTLFRQVFDKLLEQGHITRIADIDAINPAQNQTWQDKSVWIGSRLRTDDLPGAVGGGYRPKSPGERGEEYDELEEFDEDGHRRHARKRSGRGATGEKLQNNVNRYRNVR